MSPRFRHLIPLLAAAACVGESPPESAAPDAATAAEAAAPPGEVIAGEFVVQLDQPLTLGVATEIGGHRVVPVMVIAEGTWLVRLEVTAARLATPLPELTLVAIADASRATGVRYAHPNRRLQFSRTPNDQFLSEQSWHHNQIRLYQAWDLVTGPTNSSDVRIAVIDTGRTNHLDTAWAAGANFIASPPNTDAFNPFSYHHGVMVAGVVSARTDNVTGVAGVCWNCTIIPIRGNHSDAGMDTAAVAAGVRWAAGLRDLGGATTAGPLRAQIANFSFNFPVASVQCDDDPTLRDAIRDAAAAGMTVVASAGNQGFTTGPSFPANCPGVIAVAATNQLDTVAGYSDRGMGIDVAAPGGAFNGSAGHGIAVPTGACDITSTDTGGIVSTWTAPNGTHCYRQSAGTSFAAPHVAGVAGLMLAARPTLSPAQIKAVLRLTASPPQPFGPAWGFTCPANACGAGRVNAHAAVDGINDGAPAIAEVAPGFVNFGTVTGSATRTVSLRNIGLGDTLSRVSAMTIVGSPAFRFGGACTGQSCDQSYSLPTGASINTQIVCEPTGSSTQTAELIYNHSGVGQARVQLSCTGNATGNLAVPASLAFGNVRVGTTATAGLALSNSGTASLQVTNLTFNNSVFTLGSSLPQTIIAGGAINLVVRCTPVAAILYSGTITVTSTGGVRTVPVTCTGVAPQIAVTPSPLTYGLVPVGSASDRVVTIHNAGSVALVISSGTLTNAAFSLVTAVPASIAANGSATVTIRCVPPTAAVHNGVLRLVSDATNAPTLDTAISCTGSVGVLAIAPNPAPFGNVRVGTSAELNLTVRNDGSAPLTVLSAHVLTGTTFTRVGGVPSPLAPGATGLLTARCTPPTVGTHTGTLRVTSNANTVDVELTCTGVLPGIVVAPTAIDFGVVEVGGRAPRSVTITSTGTGALSVTSIVASGGAFAIADQSMTLPQGASAVITPRCAPTGAGTVTGWIDVHSDAGTRRVELTCTGGQAQLIAPTWIDLPDVLLGSATTASVYLSNPGNVPLAITSATIVGGNGFSFTGMPTTIAPGASAAVTVRCSPSVVGYFSGSLQLASNAAASPTSIGLGCRATTGRITVLAGANLELGWCESGTVTLQNSGVGPLLIAELHFTDIGMSTSGIALPATLAAGEITSWQVDCDCWKPGFSISAKHYAKHDGVQEGSFAYVTCGVDSDGGTIELPIDPPPATE